MTVIYKGAVSPAINSNGITYKKGVEYNVTDKVGEYLLKTFGSAFEAIIEAEVVETKPKLKAKVAPMKVEADKED